MSTGRNERVEVIRDMALSAAPSAGEGEAVDFSWNQQLRLVSGLATGELSYQYEADAVPLLVGPRSSSPPLSLFDAPGGWYFAPGTYTLTLTAERVVTGDDLRATFDLTLRRERYRVSRSTRSGAVSGVLDQVSAALLSILLRWPA